MHGYLQGLSESSKVIGGTEQGGTPGRVLRHQVILMIFLDRPGVEEKEAGHGDGGLATPAKRWMCHPSLCR